MTLSPLATCTDFACTLADEAGHIARRHFRTSIAADIKADNSPVTIADREIERMVRERIAAEFPDHGILGEEEASTRSDAEFVWTIDPIDGTKSFLAGKPLFTTLIGLAHRGRPALGVIDQPHLGERWVGGDDIPSTWNKKPIRVRTCATLGNAAMATTTPDMFTGTERGTFDKVRHACHYTNFGNDAYAYGLLASGFLDIVLEADLKPYDFCPLVPIIENAGGIITDWQGNPLTIKSGGHVLACGDRGRHKDVLQLIGG